MQRGAFCILDPVMKGGRQRREMLEGVVSSDAVETSFNNAVKHNDSAMITGCKTMQMVADDECHLRGIQMTAV